jgi:hypothetical protein
MVPQEGKGLREGSGGCGGVDKLPAFLLPREDGLQQWTTWNGTLNSPTTLPYTLYTNTTLQLILRNFEFFDLFSDDTH